MRAGAGVDELRVAQIRRDGRVQLRAGAEALKPFVVIMGGAKVSDKIEVLSKLMEKADTFLIGGAMANTFLAAEGYDLGASKIEGDKLDLAREILAAA